MSIPRLNNNLSIMSALGDYPGSQNNLNAAQMKAKHDEAGLTIQSYLNGTLVPIMESALDAFGSGVVSGKNLLHNCDFRNPVNQRGQSSYTSTGNAPVYSIDCIRLNNATLTVNPGVGVTISSNGAFGSFVEFVENYALFAGKTITFSAKILGGTGIANSAYISITDGVQETAQSVDTTGIIKVTKTLSANPTMLLIVVAANTIASSNTIQVESIKLELGTVSTLASDPPADYGEELRKCRRYFRTGVTVAVAYNAAALVVNHSFPRMRVTPTISIFSYINTAKKVSTWANMSVEVGSNAQVAAAVEDAILSVQDNTNPYTSGASYVFRYTASADL